MTTFTALRELMLVEEFKKSLQERMLVHLNEQRITTLSAAAVMADEYVLTHRVAFPVSSPSDRPRPVPVTLNNTDKASVACEEERECFYCHKTGHLISNCLALKRKEPTQPAPTVSGGRPKGVCLIKSGLSEELSTREEEERVDPCFKPFISEGWVSLTGSQDDQRSIQILRDTACSQSVILANTLPFSAKSACGYSTVLQGVEMGFLPRPLH